MADINIERSSRNIWPWLIGLVALVLIGAVVLYFVTSNNGVRDLNEPLQQEQFEEAPDPAPAQPMNGTSNDA